jgi:hypothetical protein
LKTIFKLIPLKVLSIKKNMKKIINKAEVIFHKPAIIRIGDRKKKNKEFRLSEITNTA